MFTTGVISFREFLEAFLIVGVFLGISKKLKLSREIEIVLAAGIGFAFSLGLATITYIFGDSVRGVLTQQRAELLQSYLLIFSGFFIAYVVFSLHNILRKSRGGKLISAHQKLQNNAFDISLFITIAMLVTREGFEIALFTASTSLFSVFLQNFLGLLLGFFTATILGVLTYISYLKFPIGKIFKVTEYMIILLGAALVQNGITEFSEHTFGIRIGDMVRLPLGFLPDKESIVGHFIRSMSGIDREFSLIRLSIMIGYILVIYMLFLRKSQVNFISNSRKA